MRIGPVLPSMGRTDFGVTEIEPGHVQRGAVGSNRGGQALGRGIRLIALLGRRGVLREQRSVALLIVAGAEKLGRVLGQLRTGLLERGHERLGIDLEKKIAGPDDLTFLESGAQQLARNARRYLYGRIGDDGSDRMLDDGDVPACGRRDDDRRRRRFACGGPAKQKIQHRAKNKGTGNSNDDQTRTPVEPSKILPDALHPPRQSFDSIGEPHIHRTVPMFRCLLRINDWRLNFLRAAVPQSNSRARLVGKFVAATLVSYRQIA